MRLVMRAELRSVIWGGSIVKGSASSRTTIATFGGAAAAPLTRQNATSRASAARRRISMRGPLPGRRDSHIKAAGHARCLGHCATAAGDDFFYLDLIAAGMFNQGGSDALRGWYLRPPPDR